MERSGARRAQRDERSASREQRDEVSALMPEQVFRSDRRPASASCGSVTESRQSQQAEWVVAEPGPLGKAKSAYAHPAAWEFSAVSAFLLFVAMSESECLNANQRWAAEQRKSGRCSPGSWTAAVGLEQRSSRHAKAGRWARKIFEARRE